MNWNYTLRTKFAHYKLQKELKSIHREHKFINLSEAKEIGFLFDGSLDEIELAQVMAYMEKLKKKKKNLTVLGYWPKKDSLENQVKKNGFDYFTRKDLNWLLIPDQKILKKFADKQFDVLICINTAKCFPLLYISALSKAKLRVGKYEVESTPFFDLMINQKDSENLKHYFDQVDHYLELINKENAQ